MNPEPRIAAWDRRVDWPLTALAVAFLVAYAWSVLDTTLSPLGRDLLEVLLTGTWVVFGIDYVVRIALARDRRRFVLTHLWTSRSCCCPCCDSSGRCG